MAVPVVAYALPGLDGLIDDGVNGYLVPPRRRDLAAARLDALLLIRSASWRGCRQRSRSETSLRNGRRGPGTSFWRRWCASTQRAGGRRRRSDWLASGGAEETAELPGFLSPLAARTAKHGLTCPSYFWMTQALPRLPALPGRFPLAPTGGGARDDHLSLLLERTPDPPPRAEREVAAAYPSHHPTRCGFRVSSRDPPCNQEWLSSLGGFRRSGSRPSIRRRRQPAPSTKTTWTCPAERTGWARGDGGNPSTSPIACASWPWEGMGASISIPRQSVPQGLAAVMYRGFSVPVVGRAIRQQCGVALSEGFAQRLVRGRANSSGDGQLPASRRAETRLTPRRCPSCSTCFRCSSFHPVWVAHDTAKPINDYCNTFEDFFSDGAPITIERFFPGAYTYHWHNQWTVPSVNPPLPVISTETSARNSTRGSTPGWRGDPPDPIGEAGVPGVARHRRHWPAGHAWRIQAREASQP